MYIGYPALYNNNLCFRVYLKYADAAPYHDAYFGLGVNPNVTRFRCYGNESGLLDCLHSTESCSVFDTAGVHCRGKVVSGKWVTTM